MILLALVFSAWAAACGSVNVLPPGPHPTVDIRGKRCAGNPIVIVAGKADVAGVRIWDSQGITWNGGTVRAADGIQGAVSWGFDIRDSVGVTVSGATVTASRIGIMSTRSKGLTFAGNAFVGLRSDGINTVSNSDVLIAGNRFAEQTPNPITCAIGGVVTLPHGDTPAECAARGGVWRDGDHPDAIQIWNQGGSNETRRLLIARNVIEGDTQGINTFGPIGAGHFGVRVTDNLVRTRDFPAAVSVFDCTTCEATGNTIAKLDGGRREWQPVMRIERSTGRFCGNFVEGAPWPGPSDPRTGQGACPLAPALSPLAAPAVKGAR